MVIRGLSFTGLEEENAMVRFTTTISLPPDCLGYVESFHKGSNGKKSFSAWVATVIRNRKRLGVERAEKAEKEADFWHWVAYRMSHREEPLRLSLRAVKTFHDTCWANRDRWSRQDIYEHMMMEMPPRSDDVPLPLERGEEE